MAVIRVGAGLALGLALMFLVGCEEAPVSAPTTENFAAQREELKKSLANKAVKKPVAAVAAAPAPASAGQADGGESGFGAVVAGYVYDPEGKRDPFRSFQYLNDEPEIAGFGPLGDYELGQLSLVAVVWDTGRPRALIADPGGRSFIIGEGSQVGKNSGRVIHIGDDLVLVKETYVDFEGVQSTKDVEMRIRRSQGG